MAEADYDVVIVGARCAGSPLATLLARAGARVALLEQATFPKDTLSTHLFEADALVVLEKLGVLDELVAAGMPLMNRADTRLEDIRLKMEWPRREGDPAGMASCRRHVLDPILANAAAAAGAELRMGTKVTGLARDDAGRVSGVRVDGGGELRARLVVGADGRSSTVAREAGARRYNLFPNERANFWAYYEGASIGSEPEFVFHRWADRMVVASPTDSGLYCVQVLPERGEVPAFNADTEKMHTERAMECEPVAEAIGRATRVGKHFRATEWTGYFRDAAGPGWVLVGDAAHFKDPAPGRGIADALLQVERLAGLVAEALGGSDGDVDGATAEFGSWRDDEFAEYYWFGSDLGTAGTVPIVLGEIVRGLMKQGAEKQLFEVTNHRRRPTELLTPPRLLGAVARLMRAPGGHSRRAVLREVAELGREDGRRRRLNRKPAYEAGGS